MQIEWLKCVHIVLFLKIKALRACFKYITLEMIETFLSYFFSRILGSKRGGYSKVVENVGKARFLIYKGCNFEKKKLCEYLVV